MNAHLNNGSQQMTLDFEPSLVERHPTALSCVRQTAYSYRKNLKWIAGEMDLSESELSRKLAQNDNDTRKFTLDDLESFVEKTGDKTPILYLAAKFLADKSMLKDAAMQQLMRELPDVLALVKTVMAGQHHG